MRQTTPTQARLADRLFKAYTAGQTIAPLSVSHPELTINDAYAISLAVLELRLASGERVIGKKIGVTSKAVQDMLGVFQPDFGFLTDTMLARGGIVDMSALIQPRAEAEIAFRLKSGLKGPGVSGEDVIAATESVVACFEIVDSRIDDWKINIVDTVADNASCGVFVLGEAEIDPASLSLPEVHCTVIKNGAPLSQGLGSAVQGAPQNAVAWLANTLGERGIPFEAGEIILSGSLVPLEPVIAGDEMHMRLEGIGECSVKFV